LPALRIYTAGKADNALVEKAVQSPVLQTYSKAPEHRYKAGIQLFNGPGVAISVVSEQGQSRNNGRFNTGLDAGLGLYL